MAAAKWYSIPLRQKKIFNQQTNMTRTTSNMGDPECLLPPAE
jgi:hypothetical protein